MTNLDEQIKKLLKNSLFLDKSKKDKIEEILAKPSISVKKKEALLKILESENGTIKKNILEFLKSGGSKDALDRLFVGQGKIVSDSIENEQRGEEMKKAEQLISDLD